MGITKLVLEEKRDRQSVTQGSITVYANGEEVATFADNIQLVKDGEAYYGELIGGWASMTPDGAAIRGLLYNPLDSVHHLSHSIKKLLPSSDNAVLPLDLNRDEPKLAEGTTFNWICPTCGREHKEKGNFCTNCGQRVVLEHTGRSEIVSMLLDFGSGTKKVINSKEVQCENWYNQKFKIDGVTVKGIDDAVDEILR